MLHSFYWLAEKILKFQKYKKIQVQILQFVRGRPLATIHQSTPLVNIHQSTPLVPIHTTNKYPQFGPYGFFEIFHFLGRMQIFGLGMVHQLSFKSLRNHAHSVRRPRKHDPTCF